ncbi:hypothetical protein ACGIF2_12735 [Cellulomonas sp. P22]|uniref:hypothetical protein n=1 Tax=Cellulomonas sp. P22 TaxID=3373189 RepID=UPI0037B81901
MPRPGPRPDRRSGTGRAAQAATWTLVGAAWVAVAAAAVVRLAGGDGYELPEAVEDALPPSVTGLLIGAALTVVRFTVRLLA